MGGGPTSIDDLDDGGGRGVKKQNDHLVNKVNFSQFNINYESK